ncbi:nucleoside hydrolase [Neorhodopirellula pilleata]|uniref:Inosine-uridine preferring nucleoside hydrolase n=1 Tax=Neorhodopirellula pilleata TaxID=2714738 RepID=A0A5C6APC7_9BACT|nr:nucleoside hydrolase [Neorhodopirellula pilleata]TWU01358.1 Inosine-uridine preferring nucleoside hydrolase [Neorhodopirellula pilleata]
MKRMLALHLISVGFLFAPLATPITLHLVAAEPVKLIFDTDMGNDCDDVLALGMIHALQSRGECELLAVTITKDHSLAAPFVDVVNTFYGRGDIPIGVCDSGVTDHEGRFNVLAAQKDEGEYRYAHDLITGDDTPGAVDVLRQTLADQEDGSVVIAQVGFSTNLANLLRSVADQHSDLNGIELVRKKVRLLSIMAGAFTKIPNNEGQLYDHKEYNIIKDIPSAQYLVNHWPQPIVWSGFEIGRSLPYPSESIEQDYRYVDHHPLAEAYVLYNPPPHNRPTWDLTSVLHAVRPDRGYFDVSLPGNVIVAADGLTTFQADEAGKSRYLQLTDAQKIRTTETLVQLSSQPPTQVDCEP